MLLIDHQSDTYFSLQPAVDIVTEVETEAGLLFRPKLTLGITQFLGDTDPSVTGQFLCVSDDVAQFETSTELDSTRFNVTAGIEVFSQGDVVVGAEIFGSFSDDSESYGGGLRAEIPF